MSVDLDKLEQLARAATPVAQAMITLEKRAVLLEAIVRDLAAKEPRVVLETPLVNGDRYQCALCGAGNRDGGAIAHLTGCSYRRAVEATKP